MSAESSVDLHPFFNTALGAVLPPLNAQMTCFPALLAFLVAFGVALILRYYHNKRGFKTQLYYRKTRLSTVILKRCQRLNHSFMPTFWASNCHFQTILPWLLPKEKLEISREHLQMADKGVIALDWVVIDERVFTKASPIVVLIADSTAKADDLADICSIAITKKFRPVFFNRRGQGGTPLTTPRLQSFCEPSDLEEAVTFIKSMYPCAEITAIGFSTGSGLLVSYLGELGLSTSLAAAVCISPIYDTEGLFKKQLAQPYDFLLTWKLKRLFLQHPCIANAINFDSVLRSRSVRELDEKVYVKLNNYGSLDEYWKYNNPMRNVASVSIPVLCINALDDPICPKEAIPFSLFKTSSNFFLVTTEKGGHCGFLENTIPSSWANKTACEYLEGIVHHGLRKTNNNYTLEDNHVNFLDVGGPRSRSYTT